MNYIELFKNIIRNHTNKFTLLNQNENRIKILKKMDCITNE